MSDIETRKTQVTREELYYDSAWRGARIRTLIWMPPAHTPVRAVLQIAHGMVEHVARYDDFARFLAAQGIAVAGNDQIGHGKSAKSVEAIGALPPDGARIMVNDANVLRLIMEKRCGELPYFLFGHSMGSFIVRAYLAKYGDGLCGAIICGTAQQPLAVTALASKLARGVVAAKGWEFRSSFLQGLGMESYSKSVEQARTPFDWLSTDPAVVDDYIADPMCGASFSAGGYVSLFDLVHAIATRECVENTPIDLPVLFISGAEDPVGDRGEDVLAAAEELAMRASVSCTIYDGMRHEILNEPEHRQVYDETLAWIEGALPKDVS